MKYSTSPSFPAAGLFPADLPDDYILTAVVGVGFIAAHHDQRYDHLTPAVSACIAGDQLQTEFIRIYL